MRRESRGRAPNYQGELTVATRSHVGASMPVPSSGEASMPRKPCSSQGSRVGTDPPPAPPTTVGGEWLRGGLAPKERRQFRQRCHLRVVLTKSVRIDEHEAAQPGVHRPFPVEDQ